MTRSVAERERRRRDPDLTPTQIAREAGLDIRRCRRGLNVAVSLDAVLDEAVEQYHLNRGKAQK